MSTITAQRTDTYLGHKDCVYALEQNTIDGSFYSAGADGFVVNWALHTPNVGTLMARVNQSVYALKQIPNTQLLLVGQNFKGIHLIDVNQKAEINSVEFTSATIFDIQVWNGYVISACGDGMVHVHEAKNFMPVARLAHATKSARCIAIHPHLPQMAVGYSDFYIRVYELNTWRMLHEIPAHNNSVFTLQYSPDGKYLISGSRDAHLKIWDVAANYTLYQQIVAHLYAINHIAFHPKGHLFATCSMDKSIKIWDSTTFRLLKVLDKSRHAGHGTSVNKVLWLAIDEVLITCSDDRTLGIWSIKT
jgi:WD40 repeat protein